jgi:hypothetical protein
MISNPLSTRGNTFIILCLFFSFFGNSIHAQITTTITCTGTSGSFKSGAVNPSGTKFDGQITNLNVLDHRGWANFNLSSIPVGATILSASLTFTTYSSSSSTLWNTLYGFNGDPASMSGSALYAACIAGPVLDNSAWNSNQVNSKTVSAAGIGLLQAQLGGTINVSYVRTLSSASVYNIHGYAGAAPPTLTITYLNYMPCSGMPNPGNTIAPSNICSLFPFTLSLSGSFTGLTNITYQWERASNATFTLNQVSLGNASTQSATISTPTYFRCLVTCTASGQSVYSNPILVSSVACLCTSLPTSSGGEEITNVTFGPLNNSSTCNTLGPGPGSLLRRYSNYTNGAGGTTIPTVSPGFSIPFSFTQTSCGSATSNRFICWIDFNGDGDFSDAGEEVYSGPAIVGNHTDVGYITIPYTLSVGITTMRVAAVSGTNLTSCQNFTNGEVEDYTIQFVYNDICIFGPPNFGSIQGPSNTCANDLFTLSLAYPPLGISPIVSYLWQRADDSTFTTNLTNLDTTQTITTSQTSSGYYRCITTCNTYNSTYTTPRFFIHTTSWPNCMYCPTNSTNGTQEGNYAVISQVICNNINNISTYPVSSPYYTDYTSPVVQLVKGQTTYLTVTHGLSSRAAVWIDYNQSGTFDASEYTFIGSTNPGEGATQTAAINIPSTAISGLVKMRIRSQFISWNIGPSDACSILNNGETEDYLVQLLDTLPPCTGAPSPGNTLASADSVCAGAQVNLWLQQTSSLGPDISYQWQQADDSAFTNNLIMLDTNAVQSANPVGPKYYRCLVTCSNSGLSSYSTAVKVEQNIWIDCYCSSSAYQKADVEIFKVTVNGNSTNPLYANTTSCSTPAPGAGSLVNRYSNFKSLPALQTLIQGTTCSFTVEENECDGPFFQNFGTAIWIDYNHNGNFDDAGEQVFVEPTAILGPRNVTGNFMVPLTADTGATIMRVIAARSTAGSDLTPCLHYNWGETEDYRINIQPPTVLNLNVIIEGYWNGTAMNSVLLNQGQISSSNVCDSITVELRPATSTSVIAYSSKTLLMTNGTATASFPIISNDNYYVVITHRNGIQTWSATALAITTGSAVTYNFTEASTQAFGSNQREVESGIFALYSGDVNQDQVIDAFDYLLLDPDVINGASGYLQTDLTGDGYVDAFDYIILDANLVNGAGAVTP